MNILFVIEVEILMLIKYRRAILPILHSNTNIRLRLMKKLGTFALAML